MKNCDCKFNKAIMCDGETKCSHCGWNPKVIEKRKAASLERIVADLKRTKSERWR